MVERLWWFVDGNQNPIIDINVVEKIIPQNSIGIRSFKDLDALMNAILQLRGLDLINEVGLVLSVNHYGCEKVQSPDGWNGSPEMYFKTRDRGSDAGLVFYDKVILGSEFDPSVSWEQPPSVFFIGNNHQSRVQYQLLESKMRGKVIKACNYPKGFEIVEYVNVHDFK